jgi:glycyl-tRNA synthetase beta chain
VSSEYLLEVRAEEIPARMLEPAVRQLATRVFEELMGRGVGPTEVETGFTPRRLVLILKGLPAGEPDREDEVTGPPAKVAFDADGNPTPALQGFAKKLGVALADCRRVATDKGEYAVARHRVRGKAMVELLAELVPRVLSEISWAKTMRWGTGQGPWVRPVHGVLSLLDGQVVPFELFGVAAGRDTAGHPVLSPATFAVENAEDYRQKLRGLSVEIDPRVRARFLQSEMAKRAAAAGGVVVEDEELLAKLAAICEIPGVMEGSFDPALLALPREVLIESLKDHQSAFTVEKEGALLPLFLTVMDRADDPRGRVRAGNEWVVEARLADARFFFGEDRKRPLRSRAGDLASLTFQTQLGSYAMKTARLERLAVHIAEQAGWAEISAAGEAARFAKVDLVTEMVKEFTSLQGVMGGIYAREDGAAEEVWQAVYDQYLPAATDDPLPRGRAGLALALADRIDTLAGIFGLGLIPTGSKDPFGLRRAAQGAVRIALESGLAIDLLALARFAAEGYGGGLKRTPELVAADLRPFLADRVRHLLGLAGFAYDEIEAALAGGGAVMPDLKARVEALHAVRAEPGFLSVVLAAKRIVNILKDSPLGTIDGKRLVEAAERDLHDAYHRLAAAIDTAAAAGDYRGALARIAEFAPVLDRFFVEVMVMAEDPDLRANRLALLGAIGALLSRVGRLTEMVVDREEHRRKHG